jgi:hypothetical protein
MSIYVQCKKDKQGRIYFKARNMWEINSFKPTQLLIVCIDGSFDNKFSSNTVQIFPGISDLQPCVQFSALYKGIFELLSQKY